MKSQIFLLSVILMHVSIFELCAQNASSTKTTQEILMSYKWVPVDMYEEEDEETSFLTYTKTQEIDSTTVEEKELEIYIATYYLSDTADSVFDKNKVGKSVTGRYLIMNRSSDPNIISTYIYELVELTEKKMIMRYLTPGMDVYGRTNTFLAMPK